MTRNNLKLYMKRIAKLYGCKLRFQNMSGGYHNPKGSIIVGTKDSKAWFVSVFCHELAHHCNQIDRKYESYHNGKMKWLDKANMGRSASYAYRAESFTDERGKLLCKQWFPEIKYQKWYNGTQYSKGFVYGYYFGERDNL